MKKLLLNIGALASVITPVVAVVSCGDDKKDAPATTVLSGVEKQYIAANEQGTIGHNASLAVNYPRFNIVIKSGSQMEKAFISTIGKSNFAEVVADTAQLDILETELRNYLKTLNTAQGTVENGFPVATPPAEQISQIVVGTFPTGTGTTDDHIEFGVNGFSSEADAIAFLKEAVNHLTNDTKAKTLLTDLVSAL